MSDALRGPTDTVWQDALRRAAVSAAPVSHRGFWLGGVAAAATIAFVILLVSQPIGIGLTSPALDEVHRLADQRRAQPSGSLVTDGFYPLWLLVAARFTNDVSVASRVISGLAAVGVLYLVYQLCYGLSNAGGADEQSCYALLALALSPSFFAAATGGSSELPHLALLLLALLCAQRSTGPHSSLTPITFAGLLVGLSLLVRPISLLAPIAVAVWLWGGRPFGMGEPGANVRAAVRFGGAFLIGSAPLLVANLTQQTATLSWGLPELGMLWARIASDPLLFLLASARTLVDYVAADDLERLSAVTASWQLGDWTSLPGAIISLAPTILKAVGMLGLLSLCWLERFEAGNERSRLPAIFLVLLVTAAGFGLVDERSPLPLVALLVAFAFACLPSLAPGAPAGIAAIGVLALLLFNELGAGYPARLAPAYRASDQVAEVLRNAGAAPNQVISSSWRFYDTRSPWKERYRQIPAYANSSEAVVSEMRRQGVAFLVFDRQGGVGQWPRLAGLMETERPPAGLTALGPLLQTDQSPANQIAIYRLE